MWTKPAATEMRFGFEVTMYVMNKQYQGLRPLFYLYLHISTVCVLFDYLGFKFLPTAPADDATMVRKLLHKGIYNGYRYSFRSMVIGHS